MLNRTSLEIPAREFVALVGASEIGKSTLCSLIPRSYEVTDGAIFIDGVDVRDVSLHSLRRNIGGGTEGLIANRRKHHGEASLCAAGDNASRDRTDGPPCQRT